MKKIILVLLIFLCCMNESVKGDEFMSIDDFEINDIQRVIDENEYMEIDFGEMLEKLMSGESSTVLVDTISRFFKMAVADLILEKECIINIIAISLCSSFLSGLAKVFTKNGVADTGFYICYISIMTISLSVFLIAYEVAAGAVKLIIDFMEVLIPSFMLSVGIVGQASALGFYQLIVVIIYVVQKVFVSIIIPAVRIYLVLTIVNNMSREDYISAGIRLLKKGIILINKVAIGLVISLNAIQGMILPYVDVMKNTTIKKIAGAIPVVGKSSEAVTEVFMGSGMLIKNSFGTAAIVVLFILCAVPVIKLLIINVSLNISAAIIQPVSDKRIVECINSLGDSIGLLAKIVCSIVLLFVITIAIICLMTNT